MFRDSGITVVRCLMSVSGELVFSNILPPSFFSPIVSGQQLNLSL